MNCVCGWQDMSRHESESRALGPLAAATAAKQMLRPTVRSGFKAYFGWALPLLTVSSCLLLHEYRILFAP